MAQVTEREVVARQRAFFASGRTWELSFRRAQLRKLRATVAEAEPRLFAALQEDLGKPAFEAYGGDVGVVLNELDHALRHLSSWMRPRRARTLLVHQPARSEVRPEPWGVVLVMSPWNFPAQLSLVPLIGALAAGNCVVLKPSPLAPATSRLLAELLGACFDPGHVAVIEGGTDLAERLLEERFDYLFFTGSTAAGRKVMAAAARHLTPLTLELGGKNPCIVDADVDLDVAARRVAWGKFFNAGQSCVAVDYLLVDRRIKAAFLERLTAAVREFYGDDPRTSPDLARIVGPSHLERLASFLGRGRIVLGGAMDAPSRYFAPTILDGVTPDDPIMAEEIFGPILPVLEYGELSEAIATVRALPPPLAVYVFTRDERVQARVLRETRSGASGINETTLHEATVHLPFGGVGESGMGAYHGKASFDLFSRPRSVLRRGFALDLRLRYPPYAGKLPWLRRLFRL